MQIHLQVLACIALSFDKNFLKAAVLLKNKELQDMISQVIFSVKLKFSILPQSVQAVQPEYLTERIFRQIIFLAISLVNTYVAFTKFLPKMRESEFLN